MNAVARRAGAAATRSATRAFVDAAAPLLKALAKLSEVKRVRRRRRRSPQATARLAGGGRRRDARLALHVEIDAAAELDAARPRRSTRLDGEIAKAERQARRTRASSRARRPRWSIRRSSASPSSRRRWRGFKIKRARLAIVGSELAAGAVGARLEQLVDAPRHRPGAAQARLARRAGDARRDLQGLDAVQRPACVERAGLEAVEPGRGDAAARQRRGQRGFVEQARVRDADEHLVRLAVAAGSARRAGRGSG